MSSVSVCSLQNSPVISDSSTPAHMDVLIVNIIRGSLLGDGCLWILGRRAAVSQIPSQLLDVVTEIQGFRCVSQRRGSRGANVRLSESPLFALVGLI